jgi:hypothetical protein
MNTERLPASMGLPALPSTDTTLRGRTPAAAIARRHGASVPATIAAFALVLVAACGGAGPSANGVASLPSASADAVARASATPAPNASDRYAQVLAYSQCMRAHGITDFPDPQAGSGGGFSLQLKGGPGSDLDPTSPTFQAAQAACQSLMPTPPPGAQQGKVSPQLQQQALAFSQCMRAHGVTKFPDPQFNGNGGVIIGAGPNSGIDPNSPTFQAAQQACQSLLPGANSGTTKDNGPGAGTSSGSSQP